MEAGVTTDYAYDRADQLQQQTIGATTRTFAYDRYGNLTQSADAASAYTTYAYDEASRLTGITPPSGGAVAFTLDALDRPATRTVAGSTSDTYGYLDTSETAWLTGTGTTTGALLDADGTRLALKTGSSVSWLVFDLHGSVAGLCPAGTTALADAYRYDGWGRQVAEAGSSTNPYRYRGLLNLGSDDLAGALLAMGAREYSSQLGTFTQEDSVAGGAANPATMNRFLYALANPATLIDPDGHMADACGGASCGGWVKPPPTVSCDANGDCHGSGTTAGGGESSGPVTTAGTDAQVPSGYRWVSNVLLGPGDTIVDPMLFQGLDGTCGMAPRPTAPFVGGPCTWYWNTRDKASADLKAWCESNPDACKKYAGDKALAMAELATIALGAGACIKYCTRMILAAQTLFGPTYGNVRDRLGGFWGPMKPVVSDPKLQNLVNDLYRATAKIGNGGTADAVRAFNGHVEKAEIYINALRNWLARTPDASPEDIEAAKIMMVDLISALAGKGFPR